MNITEAAKNLNTNISENLELYVRFSAEELPAIAADVNKGMPTPLTDSDIDDLFALYLEAYEADSTATGYAIRYGSHTRTEREAEATVHAYCDDLTHYLRTAGYPGEDYAVDTFDDLI